MYHEGGTTVVHKRMSFLAVTIISLSAIVVTVVLSAVGLGVYGLSILDNRVDNLGDLISDAAGVLPEIREALPPALADSINDQRRLDYLPNLDISVRMKDVDGRGRSQGVVQVTNRGEEIVSLLAMRLVGLDDEGDPVFEENVWAATPIQIDRDWRGPLLPGSTRRFPVRCYWNQNAVELSHEVTEIRVWRGEAEVAPNHGALSASAADLDS